MRNIEKDIVISDLVYKSLVGKLSEDEQTLLECWLKEEENRAFYEELLQPEKLYEEMSEMAELDTSAYFRELQRHMDHKRRLRVWLAIASVAAVVLCFAGIKWFFTSEVPSPSVVPYHIVQQFPDEQTVLKTDRGKVYIIDDTVKQVLQSEIEQKETGFQEFQSTEWGPKAEYNLLATSLRGNIEVTLADSTRVWLNAGSRLRYPNRFSTDRREVELEGEAYFEVTHHESQPFIVKAGTTRIEVLGTQFNVRADNGAPCITTLIKGCVKVRNKANDTVVIHPGQQVNAPVEGAMSVRAVDCRFYTAWKRDRFAFQDVPLYRLMDELSQWYGCTFEFSRPELANLHFTTIVPRYDNISEVLAVLQATHEFEFLEMGHHILITDYGHEN